ncbi:MAG: hypothetical protein JWQ04_1180 [Pedosphaera sp.]|nr:hypothetical protein [Pedosphaera sp.]
MKAIYSLRAKLLSIALLLTMMHAPSAKAGGPVGVDGGWVVNSDGSPGLTPAQCSAYTAAGVGWLRIEFRLVNNNTTWNSTMLSYYDTVINNARAAGLQINGLIDNTSWPGGQSIWDANNYENTGGNGANSYTTSFATGAVNPIVAHFHDRIKQYEIWNEPSTWTTQNGTQYTGASFMYPSVYAQLVTSAWIAVHETLGISDCKVITGGIFGHTTLPSNDPNYANQNSGASWLTSMFQMGNNSVVNCFNSARSKYGQYPMDGYGEHLYIDYNIQTTSADVSQYFGLVRNAYRAYDTSARANTYMTEFGWNSSQCGVTYQADNLATAFSTMNVGGSGAYIKYASWFTWKDGGAGDYGVLYSNGTQKPDYANFVFWETYQGYWSDGTLDTVIQNYFNGHGGQAKLGNAFDNGGSAFVHKWTGGSFWADVQDFTGGANGSTTIFETGFGGNPTYQVNSLNGFWAWYMTHGGMSTFGCPNNDQYAYNNGYRQDFQVHYLTWDPTNGVVQH